MRKFLKEWIDAAATAAGSMAGLPYEPLPAKPAQNDNDKADDRQLVFRFDNGRDSRAA